MDGNDDDDEEIPPNVKVGPPIGRRKKNTSSTWPYNHLSSVAGSSKLPQPKQLQKMDVLKSLKTGQVCFWLKNRPVDTYNDLIFQQNDVKKDSKANKINAQVNSSDLDTIKRLAAGNLSKKIDAKKRKAENSLPSEEPWKVAKTNQDKKSRQNKIEPANQHAEVSKLVKICKQTETDLS